MAVRDAVLRGRSSLADLAGSRRSSRRSRTVAERFGETVPVVDGLSVSAVSQWSTARVVTRDGLKRGERWRATSLAALDLLAARVPAVGCVAVDDALNLESVSYTHLTLPTTPYV